MGRSLHTKYRPLLNVAEDIFKPIQRRNWTTTSRDSLQVIRQPIGPDGSKGFSKQFRLKRSNE